MRHARALHMAAVFAFLLLITLSAPLGAATKPNSCGGVFWDYSKKPVRVLEQIRGDIGLPKMLEVVARSQHLVANEILATNNAAVFVYGETHHVLDSQNRETILKYAGDDSLVHIALKSFPHGIPPRYEDMNPKQILLLGKWGAPSLLWALGSIKKVYPTISAEKRATLKKRFDELMTKYGSQEKFPASIAQEINDVAYTQQENEARKHIKNFMESPEYIGQPIILVFGMHNHFPEFE